jgi:hypothetical protein
LYDGLVRLHIAPALSSLTVQEITEPRVRRWRKSLVDAGVGQVTVAKAYRLLKAIMSTAVDDGMIRRNPCRIKGAGQEKSPERPVLTIRQVFVPADAIEPRYRALILLAVFGSLRWGELAALRRYHIDLRSGTLRVEVSVVEPIDGSLVTGPPKSAAGKRIVSLPAFLLSEIVAHLAQFTGPGADSLVFVGPKNAPPRRSNFSRAEHHPGCAYLPAPHDRAGPSHRRRNEPDGRDRASRSREPIGHGAGTRTQERIVIMDAPAPNVALMCGFSLERVTGIEPALSAWEVHRFPLPGPLTWRPWRSRVTVVDPSSPWLMAR